MKLLLSASLLLVLVFYVQCRSYFELAPARKDLLRDMTNTSVNLAEEIAKSPILNESWYNALHLKHHEAKREFRNEQERMVVAFVDSFNGIYDQALREWYNSSDNRFEYYWSTRLLLESVVDVSELNISCYRGEPPHRDNRNEPYVKRGKYQQGDVLFTNQFEFCSLDGNITDAYGYRDGFINGTLHRFYGTFYTMRPKYVLNSTEIDPKGSLAELITPPGYRYKITLANTTESLDRYDTYTVEEI